MPDVNRNASTVVSALNGNKNRSNEALGQDQASKATHQAHRPTTDGEAIAIRSQTQGSSAYGSPQDDWESADEAVKLKPRKAIKSRSRRPGRSTKRKEERVAPTDALQDERPGSLKRKNGIRYQVVYLDPKNESLVYTEDLDTPDLYPTAADTDDSSSMFDVDIVMTTSEHRPDWKLPLRSRPSTRGRPKYSVTIRSKAIIRALRHVVDYYPGIDLQQDVLVIEEPYKVIVHHYEALQDYRRSKAPDSLGPDACAVSRAVYVHLGRLLDYVDKRVMQNVRAEQARHSKGLATWDMLWLLYKPGMDIAWRIRAGGFASRRSGGFEWNGGVIQKAMLTDESQPHDEMHAHQVPPHQYESSDDEDPYRAHFRRPRILQPVKVQTVKVAVTMEVTHWQLLYDGRHLRRFLYKTRIESFDGEKELSKLLLVPIECCPEAPDGSSAWQYLVQQGKAFCSLLRPQYKYYSGELLNPPFHQMECNVQVDYAAYLEKHPKCQDKYKEVTDDGMQVQEPDCTCPTCLLQPSDSQSTTKPSKRSTFSRYDQILPDSEVSLPDHQYFLCPQSTRVYVFKTAGWQLVDVSNLKQIQFNDVMLDTLVIDAKRVKMLRSLSSSYVRSDDGVSTEEVQPWNADYVKGKGNSQIFLLHGPPGVGKTYTAECIAEFTHRPLMTLTISQLGVYAYDVERALAKYFYLAKKWGAILLIDEADIYLERRTLTDLPRNSLVAAFLRALEMYEGILFLTTNRIGAFDDAFISRIHVKLEYKALTNTDRQKIWENFIGKLKAERGSTIRVTRSVHEYVTSEEVNRLKLNGREIRNIFQIAVSLAQYENERDDLGKIIVSEDSLAQVVKMSGEFKLYLDKLHAANEAKRAEIKKMRYTDDDN